MTSTQYIILYCAILHSFLMVQMSLENVNPQFPNYQICQIKQNYSTTNFKLL